MCNAVNEIARNALRLGAISARVEDHHVCVEFEEFDHSTGAEVGTARLVVAKNGSVTITSLTQGDGPRAISWQRGLAAKLPYFAPAELLH